MKIDELKAYDQDTFEEKTKLIEEAVKVSELTPGRFLDRLIEPESESCEALFNYIYLILWYTRFAKVG